MLVEHQQSVPAGNSVQTLGLSVPVVVTTVVVSWSGTRSVVINLRVGVVVMSAWMVEVVTSARLGEVVMFP